jgi:adenylate kinase family enzyme
MSSPPAENRRTQIGFAEIEERVRAAVQRVAATDPAPTDPFRGLYISDDLALELAGEDADGDLDGRLAGAAAALGLDALDTAVLALCAAPELDPRYGRLIAYLHDDVTRKLASPRLVARLLGADHGGAEAVLQRFEIDAPLRRASAIRLVAGDDATALADRGVALDERLVAMLLGARLDAADGDAQLRRIEVPRIDPGRAETVARLRALVGVDTQLALLVAGPDAAELLAAALGVPVLLVDLSGPATDDLRDLVARAALRARLEGAFMIFEGIDDLPADRQAAVAAIIGAHERPIVCARSRDAAIALAGDSSAVVEIAPPSFAERQALWRDCSGVDDVAEVAAKFRLSMHQIEHAARIAAMSAALRGEPRPVAADLDEGARQASSGAIGRLATRLQPAFAWDDLVLPDRQRELLRSVSAYLRHRDLVMSEWGYERLLSGSQGLKVLFAGESGTGKTMAARMLANELGLDIYRIDLAAIVSKYIGETEKNLDRIFAAAEDSNAILFFDEADSLFGKRTEVRDSHDRYANIEVSYLLQKMEDYPGAVVLATNFRKNIDDAFLRRLDFLVDFPFPEPDDRERIWRRQLPAQAPLGADVDPSQLAVRFKLSGGSIRNCSLAAAFLAADEGGSIEMRHLLRAVAVEYAKLGRLTLGADFHAP